MHNELIEMPSVGKIYVSSKHKIHPRKLLVCISNVISILMFLYFVIIIIVIYLTYKAQISIGLFSFALEINN